MKTIRWAWLLFFTPPLLWADSSFHPMSPEQDIVSVISATPLSDTEPVPGLLSGQRIMADLRSALELVRGGVPEAARPGLEELANELPQLQSGEGSASPLPASYRSEGELWLPVRAQLLRVRLDAPDLRPRPRPDHAGGQVGNLPAKARRIDWLPVELTERRVEEALHLLAAGESGQEQARQLLEAALQGPRSRVELEHRPLILAYYQVQSALASAPRWDDSTRDSLRRAAEALDVETGLTGLADRLQAQADRSTPDQRELQDLAAGLRKRILATVGVGPTASSP
jgi:hypothetical protein